MGTCIQLWQAIARVEELFSLFPCKRAEMWFRPLPLQESSKDPHQLKGFLDAGKDGFLPMIG